MTSVLDTREPPLPPPADCGVKYVRTDDGFELIVKPLGLRRGGRGLWGWSWFLLITGVASAAAGFAIGELGGFVPIGGGIGLAFTGTMGLVMCGVRSTSRAYLDVIDDRLMITTTALFSARQQAWHAWEIAHIDVDHPEWEMDEEPVYELRVTLMNESTFRLLPGRTREELQWLAAMLRWGLRMPDTISNEKQAVLAARAIRREAKRMAELKLGYMHPTHIWFGCTTREQRVRLLEKMTKHIAREMESTKR